MPKSKRKLSRRRYPSAYGVVWRYEPRLGKVIGRRPRARLWTRREIFQRLRRIRNVKGVAPETFVQFIITEARKYVEQKFNQVVLPPTEAFLVIHIFKTRKEKHIDFALRIEFQTNASISFDTKSSELLRLCKEDLLQRTINSSSVTLSSILNSEDWASIPMPSFTLRKWIRTSKKET